MDSESVDHKLEIRNLKMSDYDDIGAIMQQAYSGMGGAWTKEEISTLLKIFPEGQICIEDNGHVVCAALTLIVDYSKIEDNHSYDDIVDDGKFSKNDQEVIISMALTFLFTKIIEGCDSEGEFTMHERNNEIQHKYCNWKSTVIYGEETLQRFIPLPPRWDLGYAIQTPHHSRRI